MKKYILIIAITVFSFSFCKAQEYEVDLSTFNEGNNNGKYFKDINNNFQNFIGVWEGTYGIRTFRINLFKVIKKHFEGPPQDYFEDSIGGSFQIIENMNTPNETIVHNSIKYYPQSNYTTNNVVYFSTLDGINGGGIIDDNGADGGTKIFTVYVKLQILNPTQMHWIAKKNFRLGTHTLSVPEDLILTKVP